MASLNWTACFLGRARGGANSHGRPAGSRLHRALLDAMGFDLGAIHAAHPKQASEIQRDLEKRPSPIARAKALIFQREPVSVVHEAVEDGIGDGGIADHLVPMINR